MRSQTAPGLFCGRPERTRRPTTACGRNMRTVLFRRLFADYLAGGPREPCNLQQSANSPRSQTVRGLYCGRSVKGPHPKTVCGRSVRTACVRKLFAGYFADDPRFPWGPNTVRPQCANSPHSQTVRGLFGGRPPKALLPKTVCGRSLRTVGGRRLFADFSTDGTREHFDLKPSGSAACEQSAFADFSRTIWRAARRDSATQNSIRTQSANSMRSQTIRGLFGGRRTTSLRPKTNC